MLVLLLQPDHSASLVAEAEREQQTVLIIRFAEVQPQMALLSVEVDCQLQAGLEHVMRTLCPADDALGVTVVVVETTGFCIPEQLLDLGQEYLSLVFTDVACPQFAHLFGQVGAPAVVDSVLPVPATTTRTSPVAEDLVMEKGGHHDHTRDENVAIGTPRGAVE